MSYQTKCMVILALLAISANVIFESVVSAQEQDSVSMGLIAPAPEMPLFNLHSPKIGSDRDGQATLEFGYSQTRPGHSMLTVAVLRLGNSEQGQKMIFNSISNSPSTYKVRLPPERLEQVKSQGVEILFIGELSSSTGELNRRQYFKHYFKLSNSLTLGSASEQATTRQLDQNDEKAVAKWIAGAMKQEQFDSSVPEGFTRKVSYLVPGMTICVFLDNTWQQVEYLGRDEDDMVVYRPDATMPVTAVIKSSLVGQKLSEAEHFTNPALRGTRIPFKASLQLMDDSSIVIPEDHEIPSPKAYVPGMPVKVRIKNDLVEGFVVSRKYGQATVRFMAQDFWKKLVEKQEVVDRSQLLAAKSDLAVLESPDGEAAFTSNLTKPLPIPEAWQSSDKNFAAKETPSGSAGIPSIGNERQAMQAAGSPPPADTSEDVVDAPPAAAPAARNVKRYPIRISIPRGMRVVTPECPLQPGVQLGCNWGSKWYPVSVLALHSDGAVRIRWDTFGAAYDADQLREDLIISDQIFKKLQRAANSPDADPREWADASGKFKIVARFAGLDNETVVLQRPNQEEIRVRLDQLSDEDQEIAKRLSRESGEQD